MSAFRCRIQQLQKLFFILLLCSFSVGWTSAKELSWAHVCKFKDNVSGKMFVRSGLNLLAARNEASGQCAKNFSYNGGNPFLSTSYNDCNLQECRGPETTGDGYQVCANSNEPEFEDLEVREFALGCMSANERKKRSSVQAAAVQAITSKLSNESAAEVNTIASAKRYQEIHVWAKTQFTSDPERALALATSFATGTYRQQVKDFSSKWFANTDQITSQPGAGLDRSLFDFRQAFNRFRDESDVVRQEINFLKMAFNVSCKWYFAEVSAVEAFARKQNLPLPYHDICTKVVKKLREIDDRFSAEQAQIKKTADEFTSKLTALADAKSQEEAINEIRPQLLRFDEIISYENFEAYVTEVARKAFRVPKRNPPFDMEFYSEQWAALKKIKEISAQCRNESAVRSYMKNRCGVLLAGDANAEADKLLNVEIPRSISILLSGLPDEVKAQAAPIRKALADKNFDLAVALYDDLVFDGVL